jgi:hypothetical protein
MPVSNPSGRYRNVRRQAPRPRRSSVRCPPFVPGCGALVRRQHDLVALIVHRGMANRKSTPPNFPASGYWSANCSSTAAANGASFGNADRLLLRIGRRSQLDGWHCRCDESFAISGIGGGFQAELAGILREACCIRDPICRCVGCPVVANSISHRSCVRRAVAKRPRRSADRRWVGFAPHDPDGNPHRIGPHIRHRIARKNQCRRNDHRVHRTPAAGVGHLTALTMLFILTNYVRRGKMSLGSVGACRPAIGYKPSWP